MRDQRGLKGDLSLGRQPLRLHSSPLRHIPVSLIGASPACRFAPTSAGGSAAAGLTERLSEKYDKDFCFPPPPPCSPQPRAIDRR